MLRDGLSVGGRPDGPLLDPDWSADPTIHGLRERSVSRLDPGRVV